MRAPRFSACCNYQIRVCIWLALVIFNVSGTNTGNFDSRIHGYTIADIVAVLIVLASLNRVALICPSDGSLGYEDAPSMEHTQNKFMQHSKCIKTSWAVICVRNYDNA